MFESDQDNQQPSFFNLQVDGIGYLNRVRTIHAQKGQAFMACTVSALRGMGSEVGYTKFDCRVSGEDAQLIISRLEGDIAADKAVLIGFRIVDIYPELFTFEKGDKKGQPGISIKGRLLRIKFAKVNGEPIALPPPVWLRERDINPF